MPKKLAKSFAVFALLTAFIGFYFLLWSINPFDDKDFHPSLYYGAMILISGFFSYFIKLPDLISVSALKDKIKYIMNLMIVDAVKKGHVKDEDRYEEEIVFPALDKLDEK